MLKCDESSIKPVGWRISWFYFKNRYS